MSGSQRRRREESPSDKVNHKVLEPPKKKKKIVLTGPLSFRQAAFEILKRVYPAFWSAKKITSVIIEENMVTCSGATPQNTCAAIIYTDIKNYPNQTVFVKNSGKFSLRPDWQQRETAFLELSKDKKAALRKQNRSIRSRHTPTRVGNLDYDTYMSMKKSKKKKKLPSVKHFQKHIEAGYYTHTKEEMKHTLNRLHLKNYWSHKKSAENCEPTIALEKGQEVHFMCPATGVKTSRQGDMGYGAEYTHVITEQRTWAYSGTINTLEENDKIAETYVFSLGYSKDDDVTVVGVDTDNGDEPFTSGRINHSCDWSKATVHYGVLNYKSLHIPCVQTLPGAIIAPGVPVLTNYGWSFEPEGEFTYCHCYTQYCGGFIEQNLTRNICTMAKFVQPQRYPKLYMDVLETSLDEASHWDVTKPLPNWLFQKETHVTIKLMILHCLVERLRKEFPDHTKRVEHMTQDLNDTDESDDSDSEDVVEMAPPPLKVVELKGKSYNVYNPKQFHRSVDEDYLQGAIDEINRYIEKVVPFIPFYNEEKSATQIHRFGLFWDGLTNHGIGDGRVVYTLLNVIPVNMMILRRFMQYASWVVSRLPEFIAQAVKYVKLRANNYGRHRLCDDYLNYEMALKDEYIYHYEHGSARGEPLPMRPRSLHWLLDQLYPIRDSEQFVNNYIDYVNDEAAYYANFDPDNKCLLQIPTAVWDYCEVLNFIYDKHGPPVIHKDNVLDEPSVALPSETDIMSDSSDDEDDDVPLPLPYASTTGDTPHEPHYHWIANPWAEVEQGPVIKRYFREPKKTEHKNDVDLTRLDIPIEDGFEPVTGDVLECVPSIEREEYPFFFEQKAVFDPHLHQQKVDNSREVSVSATSSEDESESNLSDAPFPSHIKGHIRMPFLYANPLTRTWLKLFKRAIPPAFTMPLLPANNVSIHVHDEVSSTPTKDPATKQQVTPPESPVQSISKPVHMARYVNDEDTE